ncbi:MAG: tRNA 2-methylthio-N6-isopentenyl adenosine(37) hydroxylase MiaE [Candidatus Fluviicola riflensis]|nr:MAG: tRNA 2-methylthio-N6-isopentenyl adenosine(37) hydroxylase MiaE [Candidatus Fluviicola riflensis]OGS78752.1 MAG: tRNA 2-methylthio-N6-isopentenyl adenosine(37) hydroxylase MiaE [Candidatus Fluviicola riflensis]OGS86183.1 MAG: tRNA 2-methylthio-N6-isopentenyl adenosine(37) hydroxylase MiaE [Fluviicola sp. RIFCSPHIGHO2_01_FULL_43_53]OGS87714.1 MAG: tRNA 2-methylthio-N6-isopentenyl adenosine(37) hydroxylase MiaE [Fluviicola sp. RIFCSPHIGHO2_12_FULL_43_24]
MLGLKLPTDPRWVNIVEKNIQEILIDHAYCEQKAATNAITIIVKFPEYPDVVQAMIELCREEMEHFGMVHTKLIERGYELGVERKDAYVNDLLEYLKQTYPGDSRISFFVNRMLFSAMIEARSCERFRLLSEEINDEDLRVFYRSLMESEARHYTGFLQFARKYGEGIDVEARWQDFLAFEATLMGKYGKEETIHG